MKDDDDMLTLMRKRHSSAIEEYRDTHAKAEEDLRFLTGQHWDDDVLAERQGRPTLTIDRISQFINQVEGDIRQNRVSIKVAPRENADKDTAEVIEGLIRQIEDACDAPTVYASAGVSAASCSLGFFRLTVEDCDDETFNRELKLKRIANPFSVLIDPAADEETGEDARWCFVTQQLSREVFEEEYPDAVSDGFFSDAIMSDWCSSEEVTIAEYWTAEDETYKLSLLSNGRYFEHTDDLEAEAAQFGLSIVETREKTRKRITMRKVTGGAVLSEREYVWPGRRIPIFPVYGREVHLGDRVVRKSVIRGAKDSQRLLNYAMSSLAEAAAIAPKAPYLVTDAMIEDREEEWDQAHTGNVPRLTYKPDPQAPGGPRREPPPPIPPAMVQLVSQSIDDMKASTGIYDAALGNRSNETSGVAIRQRQMESDVGTFVFTDNLRRAIRACGREMLHLIPLVYDTPRMVRILGADMQDKVVEVNGDGGFDLTTGKYDMSIQTGQAFGTRRQESVAAMTEVMRSAPTVAPMILDIVARNSDWPGAAELEERLKKMLPPGMVDDDSPEAQAAAQQAAQQQAVQQSIEQMRVELEMRKAGAEVQEAEADAEKTRVEAAAAALELALQQAAQSGQFGLMLQQAAEQGAMAAIMALQGGASATPQPANY